MTNRTRRIGIPYARVEFDEQGMYELCPVCGEKCRATADAIATLDPDDRSTPEDAATKGAGMSYAQHYTSMHEIVDDHSACARDQHHYDAGDEHYEGAVDEHGNLLCNDCGAPLMYCSVIGDYFHAGADVDECFLVQRPSVVDDDAPAPGDHHYRMEHDGSRICALHHGSETPCPVLDLAAIVAAAHAHATCSECGAAITATGGTAGMPVYTADDGSECTSGVGHVPS